MEQCLQYGSLKHLAQLSEAAQPAWAGIAYQESPRLLSMDAMMWTHWETPSCPWTTWKASWIDRPTHPAPPMKFTAKKSKLRWRMGLLKRHRTKTGYKPNSIKKVTKIRPPTILKTSAGGSRFTEHIPEHPRNPGTPPDDGPGNPVQMLRKQLASERHQNSVVFTARREDVEKKTAVSIDEKESAVMSEEEKDHELEKRMRKRDIVNELFCFEIFGPNEQGERAEDTERLVGGNDEAT